MASLSLLLPISILTTRKANTRDRTVRCCRSTACYRNQQEEDKKKFGLGCVGEVFKKDVTFLRARFNKVLQWGRVPEVSKLVEDLIWLRILQDPEALPLKFPSWPRPCYSELSGVDLFLADLNALEVYSVYFYRLFKMWTKPLPELYDADLVTEYFTLRPHVVAFRIIEVFTAFVSAFVNFKLSRFTADKGGDENTSNFYFGMLLKETMLDLGPTFIKIGQSLSTRPDLIGHDISMALSELHDQVPPFPRTEAMKIIEEELGLPAEMCFGHISEDPVAAASFGQVYKASTLDGVDVAIKVQRPNMRHVVFRDVYVLRIGLGLLQIIAKRQNDLRGYADELGKGLVGELDYNLEAANALEFMEVHSRFTFMHVPKVFRHLTKKRVLTMEWMVGDSPKELISMQSPESNRKLLDLVSNGVEASLVQLLDTGVMHADPHPGNLRYLSGKIGFLDFGLLCRMEEKHKFAMLGATIHIVYGDWASLVTDLREMDVIKPGTNIRAFTMDLENALGELDFSNGIPDVKFSRVLSKIWTVALKYHCRLPPYYILVLRSLASLEGLAVAVDPNFKTFEAAYPYVVQKLLFDNSAATRRILQSVVLNGKREFQWQKLSMFLRVGAATRRRLQSIVLPDTQIRLTKPILEVGQEVNIAGFALKLLTSSNGQAIRRLLMTADGMTFVRALISNEAAIYRQQLCRVISNALFQRMSVALQKAFKLKLSESTDDDELQTSSLESDYGSFLSDRRLRLIFFKYLTSAEKDPILLIRFWWTSMAIILMAGAMACQRMMLSLTRAQFVPKRIAMSPA